MKTAVALAILLGAPLIAPDAEAAQVRFRGSFVVSSATGTCTEYNPVGERALARFRPANVGTNGPNSSFSIFYHPTGAYGYVLPNASWDGTFRTSQVNFVFASSGPAAPVRIKFTSQAPAAITGTTPFVTITGIIEDYAEMIGCVANFRMGLLLQF